MRKNAAGIRMGCWCLGLLLAAVSFNVFGAQIEVSPYYVLGNGNGHYDRNPSFVEYNGEYWLFYTRGDDSTTAGVRNGSYNPDNDSYTIWYKRVSQLSGPEDLMNAPETRLDLSATARPVGFDQRDIAAVVFQGELYVFASAGFGGSQQPVYYYAWNGSVWSGPTAIVTGGGGHASAVADGDRVYLALEQGVSPALQSVMFTWDGATTAGPYEISGSDGEPRIALKDNVLYAVSVPPPGGSVFLRSCPASAAPTSWTYLSTPITLADPGVYLWDPAIFHDGQTLYVLAAPSVTWPDAQWIVQTRSTDNGATWSEAKKVSNGSPNDPVYWWDYWPTGYAFGPGQIALFFATEGYNGAYGDGMIGMVGVDWDLDHDHTFYLQAALNMAFPADDTVLAGDGDYRGFGNRDLRFGGKRICLKSKNGPAATKIHCNDAAGLPHDGIRFSFNVDTTAVFDGFTIDSAHIVSAVSCSSASPIVRNCIISDNDGNGVLVDNASDFNLLNCTVTHNGGRGVMVKATNPEWPSITIRNCDINHNGGAGIWIEDAAAVVESTDVSFNQADGFHDDSFNMSLRASNLLARGNTGYGIFIIYWNGTFSVSSSTVVENGNGFGYDFELPAERLQPSSALISNCLVAYNQGTGFASLFAGAPNLIARCNDSYGNPGGNYRSTPFAAGDTSGNISLNPEFCDTAAGNFYVSASSPCHPTGNSCGELIGRYPQGCDASYLCGDANSDGGVDISDAVFLIQYIFAGGPAPSPLLRADANCDGGIDISDAVYLIQYIFAGGPAPCANCPTPPSGALVNMGSCKLPTLPGKSPDLLTWDRCVQYQYDGSGTLMLTHINAMFNCCPKIETFVSVVNDTITIQEIEVEGICDCMCQYDLTYQIDNLPSGSYTIRVLEPYAPPPPAPQLTFTVDLATNPAGEYCISH